MRTHNTGVARVTIIRQLVRKVMGNHLIKSTSLEKLRAVSLVSAKLEIEYAMQLNISTALAYNPTEGRN